MPVEDVLIEVLSAIPDKLRIATDCAADAINPYVDVASAALREHLSAAAWIPDAIRPSPAAAAAPPPPSFPAPLPGSLGDRLCSWAARHRVLVAVLVLATGTVAYQGYHQARRGRKVRRARRTAAGARVDVVIIAGSPSLPLTRSLALDMERKGFIVYVVCATLDEENTLRDMGRQDIRPLSIDISNPVLSSAAIERFGHYLQTPHAPAPRMKPVRLTLKSVILIPTINCQASPIATIPPAKFADLFNSHLLQPILTVSVFLPLLTARLGPPPPAAEGGGAAPAAPAPAAAASPAAATSAAAADDEADEDERPPAKVLVFTPSIVSSLRPSFHAPEATVCSALSAFTEVLTEELRPLGIPVTHMRLGTFDFASFIPSRSAANGFQTRPRMLRLERDGEAATAEISKWPAQMKQAYGRNFTAQATSILTAGRLRGLRGSSLRHLHNTVFDVIDGDMASSGGTVRVGLGASMYGFVGRWAPRSLVSYVMGIRTVEKLPSWTCSPEPASSRPTTSDDDEGSHELIRSHASHDFISVPHDPSMDSGAGVWRRD